MFLTLTLRDMMYQCDNTLFDDIVLDSRVNKDILINDILINSDGRPTLSAYWQTQKVMIDNWFISHSTIISKLIDTTQFDYDPIANYDRREEYEDTRQNNNLSVSNGTTNTNGTDNNTHQTTDSGTDTIKVTGTDKQIYSNTHTIDRTGTDNNTKSGTEKLDKTGDDTTTVEAFGNATDNSSGNTTQTNTVAGYNSDTFVNHDKVSSNNTNQTTTTSKNDTTTTLTHDTLDTTTYNVSDKKTIALKDVDAHTGSDSLERGTTEATTYGKANNGTDNRTIKTDTNTTFDKSDVGSEKVIHQAHLYGNIGVTTTQQMIVAERQVVLFNIYDTIVNMFCDDMLLGIWT